MTWHLAIASRDGLLSLLAEIRRAGGTVTSCLRCSGGMAVTWFTA
jgi:hypothetical protein